MQSQSHDLEVNMLRFKSAIKLPEDIKDPESRIEIMDKLNTQLDSNSQKIRREISSPKPYFMDEVYRRIRQKMEVGNPASPYDLIIEINNLKKDIQSIKENNGYLGQRISRIKKGKEIMTSEEIPSCLKQEINNDHFLFTLEMFITQKCLVKITLLINNDYSNKFITLIDSGTDLNIIQEELIPTRYFQKIAHTLSHAGGMFIAQKWLVKITLLINNDYSKDFIARR